MQLLEGQTLKQRLGKPLTPVPLSPRERGDVLGSTALSLGERVVRRVGPGEGARGLPLAIVTLLDLAIQIAGARNVGVPAWRDVPPAHISETPMWGPAPVKASSPEITRRR